MKFSPIFKIGGLPVYWDSEKSVIYWRSGATVDADGSPRAYGPGGRGLDYLANAGHPGHWWGIATDNKGKPFIQKVNDPSPGMYVSTTSLQNPKYANNDPRRYVDATAFPFISLPPQLFSYIRLGDLGTAIYKDTRCNFIVADSGGKGHIGEVSVFLGQMLHFKNSDPKGGGVSANDITYLLYPSSGTGMAMDMADFRSRCTAVIGARGISFSSFIREKFGHPTVSVKKVEKELKRRRRRRKKKV